MIPSLKAFPLFLVDASLERFRAKWIPGRVKKNATKQWAGAKERVGAKAGFAPEMEPPRGGRVPRPSVATADSRNV